MLPERIAIVYGKRTPFCKSGGTLSKIPADELAVRVTQNVLKNSNVDPKLIDEVVFGNVSQPADSANIARVIALKAGIDKSVPAYTVHRNCASGFEAITTAANKILVGKSTVALVGGTESMSNIPLLYNSKAVNWFSGMMRSKTALQKFKMLLKLRPSMFFDPVIGLKLGLTDPVCGLNMGDTAEILSKEFSISRRQQDEFALQSHLKSLNAQKLGYFNEEIIAIPSHDYSSMISSDDGIRDGQTIEALYKLKPFFNKYTGTVTVGNSCPVTDGAAAAIIMTESKAKEIGVTPLGYMRDYAYAGLDGSRMGLGPVFSTNKLLSENNISLGDFDLIEINEAFAAQVLSCKAAFKSEDFSNKLNVNGGAIALGHPVGTSGMRLVITLLNELRRRKKNTGLASLCIGGGQGGSLWLEVE